MSYTPSDEEVILDILAAARRIIDYSQSLDERSFLADDRTQSGIIHALLIMGEATKRLSMGFRDQHPQIDWRGMAGMRDVLIHHYNRVDLETVWQVATGEVPGIAAYLETLVPAEE